MKACITPVLESPRRGGQGCGSPPCLRSFELLGPDQGTAPGLRQPCSAPVTQALESSGGRLTRRCGLRSIAGPFEYLEQGMRYSAASREAVRFLHLHQMDNAREGAPSTLDGQSQQAGRYRARPRESVKVRPKPCSLNSGRGSSSLVQAEEEASRCLHLECSPVPIRGGSSARLERLPYKQNVGGSNPPRRIRGSGRVTAPTGVGSSRDRARRHRSRLARPFGPQTKSQRAVEERCSGGRDKSMSSRACWRWRPTREGGGDALPQKKPREGRFRATDLPIKPSFAALSLLISLLTHAMVRGGSAVPPRTATCNALCEEIV